MNTSQSSLEDIALRCREETRKFALHAAYVTDPCMALMEQALLHRDATAFSHIYTIYEPLVRNWVYQHHQFDYANEEADYFVNAALTQFYFAVSGDKFNRFDSLAQLLQYLKRCVYTCVATHVRDNNAQVTTVPMPPDDLTPAASHNWDARLSAETLWERVKTILPDEEDQLLARWCFIEDLKPAQVLEEQPDRWNDAREVSVALQRIRRRLRSDQIMLNWLSDFQASSE